MEVIRAKDDALGHARREERLIAIRVTETRTTDCSTRKLEIGVSSP